jgi:hypothetical protein
LLGEVFWQIVRFGGIGVLLGWILRSCTGWAKIISFLATIAENELVRTT